MEFQKADLVAFMQRADQDLDCRISFTEFAFLLSPLGSKGKSKPSYITPTKASQAQSGTLKGAKHARKGSVRTTLSRYKGSVARTHYSTEKSRRSFSILAKSFAKKRSGNSSIVLYRLMGEQLVMERRIESFKEVLLSYGGENVIGRVYDMLDSDRKGHIKAINLFELLKRFNINPNRSITSNLFNRFDSDADGKWTYFDVRELLTPLNTPHIVIANSLPEFLAALKNLLEAYLESEQHAEAAKSYSNETMVKQVFNECNTNNCITCEDVSLSITLVVESDEGQNGDKEGRGGVIGEEVCRERGRESEFIGFDKRVC
eukprot:TRINITY_DN3106_c0_g1_i5.p1 TRINITY_DN3106_c0_g1~~TRINITY_DN3106_c0_g1_i5.p1  ORF type:complete len:317 (+),score=27.85 TRINITY_DN3106_c0_g1_i5:643-1593(+)